MQSEAEPRSQNCSSFEYVSKTQWQASHFQPGRVMAPAAETQVREIVRRAPSRLLGLECEK